jgi:hypothetical protein
LITSLDAIEIALRGTHHALVVASDRLVDITFELSTDGFENVTVDDVVKKLRGIIDSLDACL